MQIGDLVKRKYADGRYFDYHRRNIEYGIVIDPMNGSLLRYVYWQKTKTKFLCSEERLEIVCKGKL